MSNREAQRFETVCVSETSSGPVHQVIEGRDVPISKTNLVNRTLPHRDRRMVGAWCFVDTYGPDAVITMPGMRVPQLHGAQLWVALPEDARHVDPRFEHVTDLPVVRLGGVVATVLVGTLAGATSPAQVHSPLVGADLDVEGSAHVPLEPSFEHAVVVTSGAVVVDGEVLRPGRLLYLGTGRDALDIGAPEGAAGARCLLLGGEPFEEEILMWWNFVARTHEEIVAAREEWTAELAAAFAGDGLRFGAVEGFDGPALPAPELPTSRLRPRGRR